MLVDGGVRIDTNYGYYCADLSRGALNCSERSDCQFLLCGWVSLTGVFLKSFCECSIQSTKSKWGTIHLSSGVGGYVVGYRGVVLTTVRGAGHEVPSYQPGRASLMISLFLQGELPPAFEE
ncbi:serine carboxypeptidase II-3-like protein [Tanacetum coccineum]